MVKRLAIDPGYSNGWALLNQEDIIATGTIPDASLLDGIVLWLGFNADRVIIERVPTFGIGVHARRLEHILLALDVAFPRARWILPGWWKPITGKMPIVMSGVKRYTGTQHEKDAVRMALFDIKVPG